MESDAQNEATGCLAYNFTPIRVIPVYAGRARDGILRSIDGGDSWTEVNTGLTDLRIRRLVVMGATLYAGTKDGVFRLSDNDDVWIPVNAGLTAPRSDPEAIRKAMSESGVSPLPIGKLTIDRRVDSFAVSGETLYMGMVNGLFRLADNGRSWTRIGSESMSGSVSALAASGENLYVGAGGVFRSTDNGDSWTERCQADYCNDTCWGLGSNGEKNNDLIQDSFLVLTKFNKVGLDCVWHNRNTEFGRVKIQRCKRDKITC